MFEDWQHFHRPGYLIGPATICDGNEQHDLRGRAWESTESTTHLRVMDHGAKFLLLVEKHNVFERLAQDQFHVKNSCMMTASNGYPAFEFRRMLQELHGQIKIPLYVLADNDPAGYVLFLLISQGNGRRKPDARCVTAIPEARYLGLRSDDVQRLHLSDRYTIDLNDRELTELRRLKSVAAFRSDPWQRELDQIMRNRFKLEMEAVTYSADLAESYLPTQLAEGRYLQISPTNA